MSSGNIETAFKERGTGPYPNPVRATVVCVAPEYSYMGRSGSTMKVKSAAVSDGSVMAKLMCYDEEKLGYLKVNQTLEMRNMIRREEDATKIIVITKASKIFLAAQMNVPEHHTEEGNLILNPPPSGVVLLTKALSSPPKKRISVKAKIIQEEELRNVEVKGQQVPIKTITVADESGQGKVTLWRDCANAEVRPGDHLEISDVVTNTYNNITTLSTTARSRVKKCEAPTVSKLVTIEGVSVSGQTAELLLDDGTCLSINTYLYIKLSITVTQKTALKNVRKMGL